MITKDSFGGFDRFTLANGDMSVSVISIGASVTELSYKGRNLVLSYPAAEPYLTNPCYICAAVGRYANRIANAKFSIDGREYPLSPNEGVNQLHGGAHAFSTAVWQGSAEGESIAMRLTSPDGENGYPGTLNAEVRYSLTECGLRIDFYGQSDADTVYAPTSHIYFNLDGADDVRDYKLHINSHGCLEVREGLIPTGKVLPNAYADEREITDALDTCFLTPEESACVLRGKDISMTVRTDYPAVQIYTGEFLLPPFKPFGGIAIEAEYCPDSPNQHAFRSPILRRGERFHKFVEYNFSEI